MGKNQALNLNKIESLILPVCLFVFFVVGTIPATVLYYNYIYLLYIVAFLYLIISKGTNIQIDRIYIPFLFFALISPIGSLGSNYVLASFRQAFTFLLNISFAICLNNMINKRNIMLFFITIQIAVIVIFLLSWNDLFLLGETRFGQDSGAGNTIAIFALFAIAWLIIRKPFHLIANSVFFAFNSSVLFLSFSRKGLLGYILFFGVIMILPFLLSRKKNINNIISVILKIVIFFTLLILGFNMLRLISNHYALVSRFLDAILDPQRAFGIRVDMVKSGLEIFYNNMIFGAGNNAFRFNLFRSISWDTYSHNTYIEILASNGIVGAIFFFSPLFYLSYKTLCILLKSKNNVLFLYFVTYILFLFLFTGMVAQTSKYFWIFLAFWISTIRLSSCNNNILSEE